MMMVANKNASAELILTSPINLSLNGFYKDW